MLVVMSFPPSSFPRLSYYFQPSYYTPAYDASTKLLKLTNTILRGTWNPMRKLTVLGTAYGQ